MDVIVEFFPTFINGFLKTLSLLALSGVFAFIIGVIIAAMRISPIPSLRGFAAVYTEVLRNTPLTLVLFFCAFVLPYLGVRLDYFVLAVIGLTLYTSPFIAEAIRSGINGVSVGQAEAARSLGFTFGQTVSIIVLPQAIRMVIPPLINVFIALTKNTSVAGGFFVIELFATAGVVINARGSAVFAILVAVAVFYLAITVPLGILAGRIEKKVAILR
jgi:glutamate transport system permease protein